MTPPTIEEAMAAAVELGMPASEGSRFWFYHDQSDWMIRKQPMKRWKSALALWKSNWEKWAARECESAFKSKLVPVSPMQLMLWNTELERVEKAIQNIRGSYSENMDYTRDDIDRINLLRARRKDLMGLLGIRY